MERDNERDEAMIPIRVECYAGSRADEEPQAVHLEDGRHEVVQLLDRWYQGGRSPADPVADYFKLLLAGGEQVLVVRDHACGAWFLVADWRR